MISQVSSSEVASLPAARVSHLRLGPLSGAFLNAPSLVHLNASHNAFTSITRTYIRGPFSAMPSFSDSTLLAIAGGSGAFTPSPLQVLDVSQNQLSSLSFDVLLGMTDLSAFHVVGNPITSALAATTTAPSSLLLTALKTLSLAGLGLATMDANALAPLKGLTALDLSGNELMQLPSISMLTLLASLNVHSNRLKSCYFPPSLSLKSLNVSHNDLVTLHQYSPKVSGLCPTVGSTQSIVGGYPLLEVLDISYNSIEELEVGAFDGLALPLERCFMDGNPLEYVAPPAREFLGGANAIGIGSTPLLDLSNCGDAKFHCLSIFATAKKVFCSELHDGDFCRPSIGLFLCPPGRKCVNGTITLCPSGTYSTLGAGDCTVCPDGQYTSTAGAASCEACDRGSFCVNGVKKPCSAGSYSDKEWSQCLTCPDGTYSREGASACILCEPGHRCINGIKSPCTEHTYAEDGSSICKPCSPGQYSGQRAAACTTCEAGFACNSGKTKCLERFYSESGASSCTPCPNGTYSLSAGSSVCTFCEAGYACSNGDRDPCPAWTYSEPGWDTCEVCAAGRYSEPRAIRCKECEAGYACSGKVRSECIPGTFAPEGSSQCETCPDGTYSSLPGARDCIECEAGYSCSSGHRSICPKNYFSEDGWSMCQECANGTYNEGPGSKTCTPCEPGYACANHVPAPCAIGTYSAEPAAVACIPCEAGSYTPGSASKACTLCEPGYACDAGHRNKCPPQTFASGGASKCEPCPPGTFSGAGAELCSTCAVGYIIQRSGADSSIARCDPCPAGRYYMPASGTAAAHCATCLAGYFCQGTAQPQTPCPAGHFAVAGAAACTPCPAGRFANASMPTSSSVCSLCRTGRFSEAPGSTACALCPVGRHGIELTSAEAPSSMQAACAPCASSQGYCGYGYSIPVSSAAYEADIAEYIAGNPGVLGASAAPKVASSVTYAAAASSSELPFGLPYAALVFIAAAGVAALVMLPLALCKNQTQGTLMKFDLFSLNRPVRPGEAVRSRPSFLGGILSLLVLLAGIAILVNTGFDYFAETNVSRESAMTPVVGGLVAYTPALTLDVRVMYSQEPEDGTCDFERCDSFYLEANDPNLGEASCREYDTGALCTCRCVLTASDYTIPPTLTVTAEVAPDVNSVAWSLVTVGTEGAMYELSSFATLQTENGIASEWYIEFEALPEFVQDAIQDIDMAGYMLFPSASEYRGPFKAAVAADEIISLTWVGTVASLGRRSVVSHRLTLLQALSASFGLLLAVMGGVRVGYKILVLVSRRSTPGTLVTEAKPKNSKGNAASASAKPKDAPFSGRHGKRFIVMNPLHKSRSAAALRRRDDKAAF